MTAVIRILLFALVASGMPQAVAAGGSQPKMPTGQETASPPALFEFVRQNPACTNFTDSCVICRRDGDRLNCSTPAIACVTTAPVCTDAVVPENAGSPKAKDP